MARRRRPAERARSGPLLTAAEGNPLYAQEFVRMLMDRQLLVQLDGEWVLEQTDGFPVPLHVFPRSFSERWKYSRSLGRWLREHAADYDQSARQARRAGMGIRGQGRRGEGHRLRLAREVAEGQGRRDDARRLTGALRQSPAPASAKSLRCGERLRIAPVHAA